MGNIYLNQKVNPIYGIFNIDASEPLEFCHTFDFSKNEEDSTLLNSISYLSLSSIEENSLLSTILSAIQLFVLRCAKDECAGRIVFHADELLSDNV